MHVRTLALAGVLALGACSGGGASTTPTASSGAANTPAGPPSAQQLVPTSFSVGLPGAPAAALLRRAPKYLGSGAESVQITLNTVNGAAPPAGLTTTVTTSIAPANCPCSVAGPLVPPGSDNFTLTTYDGANASGNELAASSNTYTIVAGAANTGNTVTLLGVPHSFAISGVPAGTAGTAFGSPVTLTVAVEDADGNAITGSYANPVTIADSDTSGGTTLATSGGDSPPAGKTLSSNDVVTLNYSGLAIVPATLTASATGATSATATFAPTLSPIVYAGPLSGSTPELDLYAPTGTGSSGTFTASEVGLTNSPYYHALGAATSGCSSIGTVSPSSGTSFTFTAAASPAAGTCTLTLTDGLGQSTAVTATYTTSGFGVN